MENIRVKWLASRRDPGERLWGLSERWLIAGCGAAIHRACSNLEVTGPPATLCSPGHRWHCCRRAGTRSTTLQGAAPRLAQLQHSTFLATAACGTRGPSRGDGDGGAGGSPTAGGAAGAALRGGTRPEEAAPPSASAVL